MILRLMTPFTFDDAEVTHQPLSPVTPEFVIELLVLAMFCDESSISAVHEDTGAGPKIPRARNVFAS